MSTAPLLQVTNLSHKYGGFTALHPMDMVLQPGQIAVLEGPNGSGKTTLLLCLAGLLRPTTGEICIDGHDSGSDEPAVKRCLAFVPDVPRFYAELTAWEHLEFIARAHDSYDGFPQRAQALLREFGLWEARDLFPHHCSRGMSLKLGLLLALIRPFKLLLLDEPASAIDAESRELLVRHLLELRAQGAGILLSAHDPDLKHQLSAHAYCLKNGLLERT